MSATTAGERLDEVLRDEAAHWFVLLASGEASDDERRQWQAWRARSAAHEAAWLLAENAVARFAAVPKAVAATSFSLLDDRTRRRWRSLRRMSLSLLLSCALGVLALAGYRTSMQMDWTADAVTAVGEQRSVALADGSRMVLDTDSAVDIDFSDTQRVIHLRRGQILIETAPDTASVHRDFVVTTRDGSARALGTRFTVHKQTEATRVAVLEARVAVTPAHGDNETLVGTGQSLRFDRNGVLLSGSSKPLDASWSGGFLVVDDMSLDEFAAQLSRYRSTPLRCESAACALRISGAFPLVDTNRVLEALTLSLPVSIRKDGAQDSLVAAPPTAPPAHR